MKTINCVTAGLVALTFAAIAGATTNFNPLRPRITPFGPVDASVFTAHTASDGVGYVSVGRLGDNLSTFAFYDNAVSAALATIEANNAGLTLDGISVLDLYTGPVGAQQLSAHAQGGAFYVPHLLGWGATPQIGPGDAVGALTGQAAIQGNDSAGEITITVGTGQANIGVATITFAVPYPVPPAAVIITPANPDAALLYGPNQVYVPNRVGIEFIQSEAFFLVLPPGGKLQTGVTYCWHYEVR